MDIKNRRKNVILIDLSDPICQQFSVGIIFILLLTIAFYIYHFALSAGFHFDGRANLASLGSVSDYNTAVNFIFGGMSGPLGRPLSLLTFGLQSYSWPHNPENFIYWNILFHLLNCSLVFWLSLNIAALFDKIDYLSRLRVSLLLTSIWVLHPFLASTNTMLIQRMTSLSTMFILIGLILYVKGRNLLSNPQKQISAYMLMSVGIVGGSVLGVLCKENGALLPIYCMVMETTILNRYKAISNFRFTVFRYLIFLPPILLLLGYTIIYWGNAADGYSMRPFTVQERLASQSIILWDYVRQIILPNIMRMGPFHDDYEIYTWSLPTLLATGCWVIVIAIAFFARKISPVLAFGIFWFLSGHILESTVFNLELYFEHRNYLPSLGIIVIIVQGLILVERISPKVQKTITTIYILLMGTLLLQVTSLWGTPLVAAEIWHEHHPLSSRAAQNLSQKMLEVGNRTGSRKIIEQASIRIPKDSGLALQTMQLNCPYFETQEEFNAAITNLSQKLPQQNYSNSAIDAIHKLTEMKLLNECPMITSNDIIKLSNELLNNKKFTNTQSASLIYYELYRLHKEERNFGETMNNIEKAFQLNQQPEYFTLMIGTLTSAGLFSVARDKIETQKHIRAYTLYPINKYLQNKHWKTLLTRLRQQIQLAEEAYKKNKQSDRKNH